MGSNKTQRKFKKKHIYIKLYVVYTKTQYKLTILPNNEDLEDVNVIVKV